MFWYLSYLGRSLIRSSWVPGHRDLSPGFHSHSFFLLQLLFLQYCTKKNTSEVSKTPAPRLTDLGAPTSLKPMNITRKEWARTFETKFFYVYCFWKPVFWRNASVGLSGCFQQPKQHRAFRKLWLILYKKVFCMLTFLLMCNYTEKSSKTINQALTCMKAYFSHENTRLLQRIKTNRKYILYGSSTELQITGIFPSVKQSSQKKHISNTMLSSYISA